MLELSLSIIILLWFLNRSSLLKGLKTHITMWSNASTTTSALEYSKEIKKACKKASEDELALAKQLLEGEEITLPKKSSSKLEDVLDDII